MKKTKFIFGVVAMLAAVIAMTGCDSLTQIGSGDATLKSISVKTGPDKTEYLKGNILDLTGLVVQCKYSDDSTIVVSYSETSGITATGFDSSVAASSQIITVAYSGVTTTFNVAILDPSNFTDTLVYTVTATSSTMGATGPLDTHMYVQYGNATTTAYNSDGNVYSAINGITKTDCTWWGSNTTDAVELTTGAVTTSGTMTYVVKALDDNTDIMPELWDGAGMYISSNSIFDSSAQWFYGETGGTITGTVADGQTADIIEGYNKVVVSWSYANSTYTYTITYYTCAE